MKAIVIGQMVCGECGSTLKGVGGDRTKLGCLNSDCKVYGKVFDAPVLELMEKGAAPKKGGKK